MAKAMSSLEQEYFNLARNGLLWENEIDLFFRNACKVVSDALGAERCGIFFLNNENKSLRQITQYTASNKSHSLGLNLKKRNYPEYFDLIENTRLIAINDAKHDNRSQEFNTSYFEPLDIAAKLDCTLIKTGKIIGVLSIEDGPNPRVWNEADKHFALLVADLVSQRLLYEELKSKSTYYSELSAFDEALLNASTYCIISLDESGQVRTINQAACHLLGYSSEDIIGKDFCANLLGVPSDDQLKNENTMELPALLNFDMFKQRIKEGHDKDSECFFRHSHGHNIPVSISLSEFKKTDESVSGYLCIAADITQQISTRKALQEEEARYRFVFEGSADAIFLMQGDTFVDCNKASLNMFGCSRGQLIASTPMKFSPEFQADGRRSNEKALEKINAALDGQAQSFEWLHCQYDGTQFDAEVTLNLVELHNQPHLLASVRDISQRKLSERELAETRQLIVQKNISLALLNEHSNLLRETDSKEQIYTKTISILQKMPQAPQIAIYDIDDSAENMTLFMQAGFSIEVENQFANVPLNLDIHNEITKSGTPLYIPELLKDTRTLPHLREALIKLGIRSLAQIPVMEKAARVAVIYLTYTDGDCLNDDDLETLHSLGKTVSLSLVNAKNRSELEFIAHHDSLTGLSNRAYFHQQFKRDILKGGYEAAALYLLDLDRFKEINDTLGHFTGDKILQQIGSRLNNISNEKEYLISRLGGDEFIVVVYGVKTAAEAEDFARRIITRLQKPFKIDDMSLEVDASVGVAIYPYDGLDSNALLRSADVAMYQAKRLGTGFAFYDQDRDIHTPERLAMIAEMSSSISTGQLFLHYQPKLNLLTDEITGFEALARWEHPRLGLLGPSMFIPLIEMSNSISVLTEEVLHQALAQQMQWRKKGLDYSIAVNISARSLVDDALFQLLKDLLDFYDTPPKMLELEITETALMHDTYRAVECLTQIAELGVQLSIDDFGTGYSSLAYLQNLPIHKLKLDREFVMGMLTNEQGALIVETIISLANGLDLEVIAEGVEDKDTLDKLRQMNCHMAQGYYICHPNSWESIEHWLTRTKEIS
ncbi:MAG: EAL domain-containing protein [Gammaproteobacteria bacterium]|nr:EAL domain-containing protein [Gammaproteobacteria bacterium]NNC98388.1 EAL domain-containing protein [Gammaproteobacteria bacterium]